MKAIALALAGLFISLPLTAADRPVASVFNAVNFPPILFTSDDGRGPRYNVLAPNETNGVVVFDASDSYTNDAQPLKFVWGTVDEQFYPIPGTDWSTAPYLTNQFRAGSGGKFYVVAVAADADTRNNSGLISRGFYVNTIPPSSAMATISEWLDDNLTERNRRLRKILLPILDRAAQQFRDGATDQAAESVRLFQRKAKFILANRKVRASAVGLSQAVLEAISAQP